MALALTLNVEDVANFINIKLMVINFVLAKNHPQTKNRLVSI